MEGYSHSHSRSHSRPQAASGPATFSGNNKKPPLFPNNGVNNGGFFATSYDDVFGGPPRYANLAPRAEDYSEIFGAFRSSSSSRASSIPVLDLPAVSDIDSADSVFDYSEVFGGFNDVDFAVNYDELFRPFDGGDCCSSDEAWTPVGTESLSDDSDPFALSEKSPNENYHKLSESKEFNVSFHKVNLGTSTCRPNMTHVAQLNAVSGYTCVVDGTTSLREMGAESLGTEIVDDIVFSVDSSSIMPQKHKRKTMSELSLDDAGLKSFDGDRTCGRAHAANMPHVNSTLSSVPDINFSTEPSHFPLLSRIPPVGEERKGDISKLNLGFKASDNCALKATVDGRLPSCFDMELDASSSAAASAAAMKDAMEKAQEKLKAAKVLMDKKKDGVQDTSKLGLKTDLIGGKNAQMELNECATGDTRVQRTSDRGPTKTKSSGKDRRAKTASQNLPDISAVEQPNVTRRPAEGKHGKKYSLSMDTAFIEGDGEWKEAIQYYEFLTNDDTRVASQPPSNGDVKTAVFKHQGNDDEHNSDSAGEACVPEGNRRRLKATKSVSRQDYYEKMVKVAQEVHERVIDGHVETGQSLTGVPQGNQREQKSKLGYEGEKNVGEIGQVQRAEEEESGEVTRNEEVEIRSKNVLEEEEIKKKETEACHGVPTDRKTCCPHQSRVKEFSERKEEEVKDAVKLKNDKERREVKEKRSKKPLDGFGGDGLQTACESQENGKNKDLERKVEDKRSKEAVVDTYDGERLQRTREIQENDERKDLLQRDEDENYVEVAVDGQGSETKPEECVELEEHRKYKEAPEQVIRRLREDECHNLAAGDKISGEGSNEDDNEEILEKLIEQGTVENKPLQGGEMDEAVKILKKIVDPENQKVVNGSHIKIDWEDEDQESDSSTEIELPVCNEDLKSSNGANLHNKNGEVEQDTLTSKLKSPQTEADGSQEVSARKENGQIGTVASDDERKLKAVDTTDVLVDKKPTGSTPAQVGADENENERTVHSSESLDRYGNNSNSGEVCIRSGQKLKDEYMKVAQPACDPKLVKDSNLEQAGRRRVLGGGHVHTDQEEKVKSTLGEGVNGWNEHARKKEAAHTVMPETKENIQKRSHPPNISQSNERKGKIINQNFPSEEKTKEKERDLEKEQLRKLEEEREREREREKDRMAVEIAIREARERAFADARDRAERAALERATDEARQRAMAEARERLEKACAEARERSSADKVSDARLRAERAAVERATAEARQRAIEKAMADRATFEARERMQRSVSEKYTSERDVVMRQSSMPTMHSEKFEAGDGEPAERCKARLERHRRTVERVAKALAEKNMRDVLAQREQAERSRFAETLDADIKRWSNGKEGNLRALLSTLQYILGPDSGWQPIPLTEVITAAAVKKAYRKATLSVHPDKLQQRGATIQQKYICEKIFDLLKRLVSLLLWTCFILSRENICKGQIIFFGK